MAFIRKKVSRGQAYFYLVENHRKEGRVRQSVLAYLGRCDNVQEAIQFFEVQVLRRREQATRLKESVQELESRFGAVVERPESRRGFPYRYNYRQQIWNRKIYALAAEKWAMEHERRVDLLKRLSFQLQPKIMEVANEEKRSACKCSGVAPITGTTNCPSKLLRQVDGRMKPIQKS